MRSPYTEHVASGLPNPTHFEGEVRFIQTQDQSFRLAGFAAVNPSPTL